MRKEQPNDSSPHPEQPILLEGGNFKAKGKGKPQIRSFILKTGENACKINEKSVK